MMTKFHEIPNFHIVHALELKERTQQSGRAMHTHHYIASEGAIELASSR